MAKSLIASCQCGKVVLEADGAPIATTACYCKSCQEAGRRFEHLPGAAPLRDGDGGTPMLLYRKDRMRCLSGAPHLTEQRLAPESPTRRVLATCCSSAMFLDFTKGHWLSLYRKRFAQGAPPVEMRLMTKDRPDGVLLADNVPNHKAFSGRLMLKLLMAWAAMGFRRPQIRLGTP